MYYIVRNPQGYIETVAWNQLRKSDRVIFPINKEDWWNMMATVKGWFNMSDEELIRARDEYYHTQNNNIEER